MIKRFLLFICCLLGFVSFTAAGEVHFITDNAYRQRVEHDFDTRMQKIGMKFFAVTPLHPNAQELEALKFLYAYMPLADVTDNPTTFYINNVRESFRVRKEMAWGMKVPELLFRHFVLPIRVNNENLDNFRIQYYQELKSRIAGKSMKDAILEVNHWCHEKVIYMPSDGRTSSPCASIRSAYGRCGEESTFTVAALRAVGIPARQVYTPRWAHTDDNHAWVEAWADGKWYFFGACEPEPVLNLGWFNAPASRAMLMHTKVFGHYNGPEEVMLETGTFTEINLIDNYAETARTDFKVVDADGRPVAHARIDFKIYNYAEFCTVATKYTDKQGMTFLTAGKGDMMVWASKDGKYNFAKASFGKDKQVLLRLSRDEKLDASRESFPADSLDVVPPAEKVTLPQVSMDMRKSNDRRKTAEDSIRTIYTNTFVSKEKAADFARSLSLPVDSVVPLLVKSRGNHAVIEAFLKAHPDNRAISLLKCISDKDLRDVSLGVLEDSYDCKLSQLNPRVELEMLVPYKHFFLHAIPSTQADAYRQNPAQLVKWCREHIRIESDSEAGTNAISSVGVWKAGVANRRSRDVFFVDVARSLGIESQQDPVTSKIQYKDRLGKWVDVDFDTEKQVSAPKGKLILHYTPNSRLQDPEYYTHFTVSRIKNGVTSLLSFDEGQVDMGGGTTWSNVFKNGTSLDAGAYLLVSGIRLANGSVLAKTQIFSVQEGKTTTLDLKFRNELNELSVIGKFNSESKFLSVETGKVKSVLEQTGRGYFVIGILGVGQEPTNHALRDIAKMKESFEKWGRPILFLYTDEEQMKKMKTDEFGTLPSTVHYGIDQNHSIQQQIVTNMKLENHSLLPLFIVADTFDRVVFVSQGYTIGLGAQLQKVMKE
jgi:hypothetical protein